MHPRNLGREEKNMKSRRFLLSVVLMSLAPLAFTQSDAHEHGAASNSQPSLNKHAPSAADKSFTQLKTLAGTWQGPVTVEPKQKAMDNGEPMQISLRVTSRGNALVHEMKDPSKPDDPTRYDHPLTMFYVDNDRLLLTHYCDAGNRPRMVARTSSDGKTVEFDFLDVAGSTQYGNMQHAVFTVIDDNHHIEEWTYLTPGNKAIHARMDLQRVPTTQLSQAR
jgi:hypothetical protein